ncbi:scopoletin glucosyltransferase-like [Lolium perenne]|uniref:scopoletin glucosyltransferase-like n=1 Tax=Lolium perenne TaxID=4522 RepID=UPI0021F566F6|nr:scopoletin glucosyltransferase-like [Lolium perenne]
MATRDEPRQQPLHILFFPFFAAGHLIPVADMAALFAARGARCMLEYCTILTTPVNADTIRPAVDRANLHGADSTSAVEISLMPFPDVGLPPGVENVSALTTLQVDYSANYMQAVQLFREPFCRFLADNHPVDAVVSDSFFTWSADVPRLVFFGSSVFARSCNESLLRNSPLETTTTSPEDNDGGRLVSLPGLPHRVELRQSQMMDPEDYLWEFFESNNAADQRSFGEVFNSFQELEPNYVEHFRATLGRRAWLVGPVALGTMDTAASGTKGNALPPGDGCLRWLDTKPAGSVVYVSFGTISSFSPAELREIARSLVISGRNFVWVIGGGAAIVDDWMPEGFAELTADVDNSRGFIIRGWAPQRHILNHPALGGFITHCGWNSVLEAVSAGVPMVTWPRYADQFFNEKLVVEVLKVGVSIGAKDYGSSLEAHEVIASELIARSITTLMGDNQEGDAIRKKANELGVKARSAVEKGGSSYGDVGRLMDELMARRRRRCSVMLGEEVRAEDGASPVS